MESTDRGWWGSEKTFKITNRHQPVCLSLNCLFGLNNAILLFSIALSIDGETACMKKSSVINGFLHYVIIQIKITMLYSGN